MQLFRIEFPIISRFFRSKISKPFDDRPELSDGDPVYAFEREIGEVVSCLEAGRPSTILGATLARDAVEICCLQAQQV